MAKRPNRTPHRGQTYAQKLTEQRDTRDYIIKMWSIQIALDVMAGVLNDLYGFGSGRLTKISEEFNRRLPEYIQALTRNPESDYVRDKIDQQQERIFGQDYLRWAERYEFWQER